ncbi:MAG: hypothetical protein IIU58_01570, partial [Clostridia bacterium]|nr:hypothetical protein [Clostridia bacterium]
MKRFISLLLFVCLFASLALSISAETLSSTLVRSSSADPWICTDGEYYYLATTGSTRVPVFRSKTISGLYSQSATSNIVYDSAYDPTVEELFGRGATLSGTWSP